MLFRALCCAIFLYGVLATIDESSSVHDEWSEVAAPASAPSALKSPLFIQSGEQSSTRVLGFNEVHYHQLKSMVGQGEFLMENFIDESAAHLLVKAFNVFAEGTSVHHMNADGTETLQAAPEMVSVSGSVKGEDDSQVMINMSPLGSLGFVHSAGKQIAIERGQTGHAMLLDKDEEPKIDQDTTQDKATARTMEAAPDNIKAPLVAPAQLLIDQAAKVDKSVINIALECDQLCSQVIEASGHDVTTYLTSLIAGTSVIYARDLGRQLSISYIRLWDRKSPFNRGTASLDDLRAHYKDEMYGKETYDVAHLFTGIEEGGLAYLGTVCSGSSGYNTGVSSIRGKWKGEQQPSAYNWDLIVTAHELGHNMGSGHSHSYNPPIDQCVSCAGAAPGESCGGAAAKPVSSGDPKCVQGTVMSYCHLCGGSKNIIMAFHPRAIDKIRTNMDSNCGQAGSLPPTMAAPTYTPTPAPPCEDGNPSWCPTLLESYPTCDVTITGQGPMSEYCYKTCSNCASGGGNASPVVQPTWAPTQAPKPTDAPAACGSECADSNAGCAAWANDGECEANPAYMSTSCCCSCKQTTSQPAKPAKPTRRPTQGRTKKPTRSPTTKPTSRPASNGGASSNGNAAPCNRWCTKKQGRWSDAKICRKRVCKSCEFCQNDELNLGSWAEEYNEE